MDRALIEKITGLVLAAMEKKTAGQSMSIPVGISGRHIHLSAEHAGILFGTGHTLLPEKPLKQAGEFATRETVTLVGPKGVIRGVRVLGPLRSVTQVELSRTDGFSLGISPPIRDSGDIVGSCGVSVVGECGAVTLTEGVICAARHIHMSDKEAGRFGVVDGERVIVEVPGRRCVSFGNVLIRVNPSYCLEFHLDTDEANAAGIHNSELVFLRTGGR